MEGQLAEMRSGGTDTHLLAEAAKKQADKVETISGSIRRAITAMETNNCQAKDSLGKTLKQSKCALDATIAASRLDQREWVAIEGFQDIKFVVGEKETLTVVVTNTGKAPRPLIANQADNKTLHFCKTVSITLALRPARN